MSEAHEPSYYEIALTNRQVLVAFVVLLLCVLAAFIGGVWLGRSDGAGQAGVTVADDATAEDLAALEEFKFFSEQRDAEGASEAAGATERPDLSGIRNAAPPAEPPPPARDTTLAEDVGQSARQPAQASPPVQASPPKQEPPPRTAPPPPPPTVVPPPPRPTSTPPSSSVEPSSGFVIQVFSTKDEAQAKKVREQLMGGGHKAYLSPVKVGSQTMYRVRIGPYRDRASAETSAAAVNQTFKLDTWVTAAGG